MAAMAKADVKVLPSQAARATELAKALTRNPDVPGAGEWSTQDVINVALGRGMDDLERLYVMKDGSDE